MSQLAFQVRPALFNQRRFHSCGRNRRQANPLHRAGVSVTISTDDRTVTGTTLTRELAACAEAMALSRDELAAIAVNGFRRGFAPPVLLDPLLAEALAAWEAWRSGPADIS